MVGKREGRGWWSTWHGGGQEREGPHWNLAQGPRRRNPALLIVQLADGIPMLNEDRTYSYAFSKQKLRISAIVGSCMTNFSHDFVPFDSVLSQQQHSAATRQLNYKKPLTTAGTLT